MILWVMMMGEAKRIRTQELQRAQVIARLNQLVTDRIEQRRFEQLVGRLIIRPIKDEGEIQTLKV